MMLICIPPVNSMDWRDRYLIDKYIAVTTDHIVVKSCKIVETTHCTNNNLISNADDHGPGKVLSTHHMSTLIPQRL